MQGFNSIKSFSSFIIMAFVSSSYSCNFGKEIISIPKREPTFGHATSNLQLKGQAKNCSLRLKATNMAKTIASKMMIIKILPFPTLVLGVFES